MNWRSILLAACVALTACTPRPAAVLLFTGAGTSPNDVAAVENLLGQSLLNYATANSSQLNRLDADRLSRYRLLIVPGGNFVQMGGSLTPATTQKVRNAVKAGLNYLGLCAGGFLAGHYPAPYRSFDLTAGVKFDFYAAEAAGIRKTAVRISTPQGPPLDQYWEDGPQFTGWGQVIGKYPDGTPAIVEASFGKGWVILSGIHPEAPENWRRGMTFQTPVSADTAYAQSLIDAALNRTILPHF